MEKFSMEPSSSRCTSLHCGQTLFMVATQRGARIEPGPNHNKIAQSGDSDHNTTEIACAKWFFDLIGLNEKNLEYAKVFTTGSAFAFKRKLRVDGGSKAHHAKICLRHLLYEWQARMGLSAPQVHAQEQE